MDRRSRPRTGSPTATGRCCPTARWRCSSGCPATASPRRRRRPTVWAPDDPRIEELATAAAEHFLANPAQLRIVTGRQARTEAATRYRLIRQYRTEQTPAAARLSALFASKLRAAGIAIPGPA
ncbi:hypothetical protein [Nocardia sp. CS682]|uniref:hypothetical protein n=1 Tax=Nocardia sp. CS682 TaxID=1047172 RepID=UPI0019815688|nr:hypothetical protein [Nocardia sp. CS682]